MKNLANLKSTEPSEPCSKFIAANVEKRWRHIGRFSFQYSVEKFYFEMPIAMIDQIFIGKVGQVFRDLRVSLRKTATRLIDNFRVKSIKHERDTPSGAVGDAV